ncbi:cation-translocating P-type ATPase [Pradoshia sp.]
MDDEYKGSHEHPLLGIANTDPIKWAENDVSYVLSSLKTSPDGLSEAEVLARLNIFGDNKMKPKRTFNPFKAFVEKLVGLLAIMLWAASILALISGTPLLSYVIWAIILINAIFSFIQENRADKALQALSEMMPNRVKVFRDGEMKSIGADQLVLGDVLHLTAGDKVPADCRIISSNRLMVNNSMLTGESLPVNRREETDPHCNGSISDCINLVFAGTSIISGEATAVVYGTGKQTQIGMITETTAQIKREKSTLEVQIQRITQVLAAFAVIIGLLAFCVSIFLTDIKVSGALIFAIGMIVANIPEGLMPTVSLSLALSVQRMAKKNALVRKPSAVETLSTTSVICTDKTGTLTQNAMVTKKIWTPDGLIDISGNGYEKTGELAGITAQNRPGLDRFFTSAIICSETLLKTAESSPEDWEYIGNPTEAAILIAAEKYGMNVQEIKQLFIRESLQPFSSENKYMTVKAKNDSADIFPAGQSITFTKGDPHKVVGKCQYIYRNGESVKMTEADREEVHAMNDEMASEGYRILAVSCSGPGDDTLMLLGLAIMYDPPKNGVFEAVRDCYRAGIKITVVTGDYSQTALSIAKQTGIVKDQYVIITGEELRRLSEAGLAKKIDTDYPVIFARTTPQDKLRIVTAYQGLGHIVAATGDGINDILALKKADIGISMGKNGSDAAIETSDVILLDDHFATIVEAIKEGRAIYENIRKFISYILASNIPEILPFLVMGLFNIPLALPILLVLAIDLGTDIVPAISLGKELPDDDVLDQPPRKKESHILDRPTLLRAYGFLGVIQAACLFIAFFFAWDSFGYTFQEVRSFTDLISANTASAEVMHAYSYAITFGFGAVIACQIGNLLESRSFRQPFFQAFKKPNSLMIWGVVLEIILFLLISYTPLFQYVFGTAALEWHHLILLPIFTVFLMLCEEIRKWVVRRTAIG